MDPEFAAARVLRNTILARFIATRGRATMHRALWHQVARIIRGEERYCDWFARSKLAKLLVWTGRIPL
jgi:hypothetical protein